MSRVQFLRSAGWFAPEDCADTLNVIGVGATGSHIALFAAKMGITRFRIWDHDQVEPHNLPNQTYDHEHIGLLKVEALKQVLQRFNPSIEVECHACKFDPTQHKDLLDGPLVLTVDSLDTRKAIAEAFRLNSRVRWVFETRIGFSSGEVNILNNLNILDCIAWENGLRPDSEVEAGPCNLQTCTTLVVLVASYTCHQLCAMYACQRSSSEWCPDHKTIFDLNPNLSTFPIRRNNE